jgi:hypothetical protein
MASAASREELSTAIHSRRELQWVVPRTVRVAQSGAPLSRASSQVWSAEVGAAHLRAARAA